MILNGNEIAHSKNITINPFNPKQLQSASYDVCLGRNVWRVERASKPVRVDQDRLPCALYDLGDDGDLLLDVGERVLAHTIEKIGTHNDVVASMHARSSMARWGCTVCACAGWGDVGFDSQWTMEIANLNPFSIVIPVGSRIAQMVFHRVAQVQESEHYRGQYNNKWTPSAMLPRPIVRD